MDVRNCKMCGHLFNYTNSPLCPQCNKKLEERFQDYQTDTSCVEFDWGSPQGEELW